MKTPTQPTAAAKNFTVRQNAQDKNSSLLKKKNAAMLHNFSKKPLPPAIKILIRPLNTTSTSPSAAFAALLNSPHPHRALAIFNRALANPLTAADVSRLYAAVIHLTTSAQLYPLATSLTKQLIATLQSSRSPRTPLDALRSFAGPKSTPRALDILVIAFAQMKLINQATHVLYQMKEVPTVQACNCLLNVMLKLGRFDLVWEVFDEMRNRGVEPNVFTYNILINACRHMGDIGKGVLLVEEMVGRGIDQTVHTYTIVICGLCESGDVRGATELFGVMEGAGVRPNLYTYNALIDGLFKNGDVGEAIALYGEMVGGGLMPNDVSFATLVDGLCKHGRVGDARKIFSVDMGRCGVLATVPIYNCLIDGYSKSGDLDEAFKLYAEMRRVGLSPDAVTYGILIKGLCDSKRVGEAADLLSKMQEDGVLANCVIYNTVIDGYCKAGDLEMAMETCSQMNDEGVDPNLITFSSLIDGHCKRGEMETAMGIYSEMVAKGFEPDVVTYTALIDGYSRNGDPDKLFSIEKEMLEKDVRPNVVTNTCLINGLCREGHTHGAVNLYVEKINSSDFKPNSKTYMALIYAMYRAGQYFKSGRFYTSMRKSGLVPDVVTYLLLMRGQCQMGYVLNAMMLQADMLKIGALPEDWYISCPDGWSIVLNQSVKRKLIQRSGRGKRI